MMPEGLPSVCLWPSGKDTEAIRDYHCDTKTEPRPRDVVVPPRRYHALKLFQDECGEMEWKCAGAVDDCHRGWRGEIKRVARLAIARGLQAAVEDAGWPWEVYLFAVGVGVVSAGLGGLVVWGASQLDRIP
jgi:hypothetical protein